MTSPEFNPRALKAYHRASNSGWSPRSHFYVNRWLVVAMLISLILGCVLLILPLPERTMVTGMLVQRPAKTVSAPQSGKIVQINFYEGSIVDQGDVLAVISPEFATDQDRRRTDLIKRKIEMGEQLMRAWKEDHELLSLSHASRRTKLKAHRARNGAILNIETSRLQTLQDNLRKVQQLGQPKLLTSLEWQRLSDPLMQQRIRVAQTQIIQEDLAFELEQAVINIDREKIELRNKLRKQHSDLNQLEHELEHRLPRRRVVNAPWSGKLVQQFVQNGDLVQKEDKLFNILSTSPMLTAQLQLSDSVRSALKPGDTIELKPSSSDPIRQGTLTTVIQTIAPIKVWGSPASHLKQPRFEATVLLPKSLIDSKGEVFWFAPGAPVHAWIETGESALIERLYRILYPKQDAHFGR
ncbi:MAG: HlyD family secretion protein [Pseudomonadales bacterium]